MQIHGDYILLDELIPQQKSAGGLFLVDCAEEEDGQSKPRFGRVVGYGPGAWDMAGAHMIVPETRVKVGDAVLLSKVGDYRYMWNGKTRLITKTANVVATLSKEECSGLGF